MVDESRVRLPSIPLARRENVTQCWRAKRLCQRVSTSTPSAGEHQSFERGPRAALVVAAGCTLTGVELLIDRAAVAERFEDRPGIA